MIIQPKVRGFVCITAHPEGCAANVREQVALAKASGPASGGPRRALVLGASTGYGLSSRIALAFGFGCETVGVFFERPSTNGRTASPGYYNAVAFEKASREAGIPSASINGDAFSDEIKEETCERLLKDFGPVDLVVYSLASPRRTDPVTGETHKSVLKPIGEVFRGKTVDTDKAQVGEIEIEPATPEEIESTIKVMGGEDWERWIDFLAERKLLAPGFRTIAYSYVGPDVTWPIYKNGTIGKAKEDLDRAVDAITEKHRGLQGEAYVAVNKAVVTQASSAIPVVPLYISILFRVMKGKGTHEGCIEQMIRLFHERLYREGGPEIEPDGRIHVDDLEMAPDVQDAVRAIWPEVTTENLREVSDYEGYHREFLRLFGFEVEGIDYNRETDPEVTL